MELNPPVHGRPDAETTWAVFRSLVLRDPREPGDSPGSERYRGIMPIMVIGSISPLSESLP
jgi:hypothetical protein